MDELKLSFLGLTEPSITTKRTSMKMNNCGLVLGGLALASCHTVSAKKQPKLPTKPNILFIMTDDQGAWTPAYAGHKGSVTPNLDKLKSEGVEFTNAFVTTPVCSPSRASLMTSRYANETGVTDYIANDIEGLDPAFPTWPEALQNNGYFTGLIGKWHIGHSKAEHHPTNHGYDYFMGLKKGGCFGKNAKMEKDGVEKIFPGLMVDVLTDDALAFLENNKSKQFCLSLHYRAPHAAYLPVSDEVWEEHKDGGHAVPTYPGMSPKKVEKKMKEYMAAITGIDVNIGRIMKKLEELGLVDNTVVIFTSDHGYNVGHHGIWAKGNGLWMVKQPKKWPNIPARWRPNLWDTSLRVPFIVRWPKIVKPGTVRSETIDFTDIYPTLCKIGGADIPKSTIIRGNDFTPLLRGMNPKWDNDLYCEYDQHTGGANVYMRSYRTAKWKLMVDFNNPGRGDLFNLENDPDELTNLFYSESSELKEVKQQLLNKILARMSEVEDSVLKKTRPWLKKTGLSGGTWSSTK